MTFNISVLVLILDILFDKNTIFCKQLQTKYFIARKLNHNELGETLKLLKNKNIKVYTKYNNKKVWTGSKTAYARVLTY